jgi:hypothetical protein
MQCTTFQFGNVIFQIFHHDSTVTLIRYRFVEGDQYYQIPNVQVMNTFHNSTA